MIALLRGRIARRRPDGVVVDVGGVGYQVGLSATSLAQIGVTGESVELHVHTHVREDQIALYGFLSAAELEFFQDLIQVDQVGPRLALAILGSANLDVLRRAVLDSDVAVFRRAPGVGARTAQKVIIDLMPKLVANPAEPPPRPVAGVGEEVSRQVEVALRGLGFAPAEARRGIEAVRWEDEPSSEAALAQALRALGR